MRILNVCKWVMSGAAAAILPPTFVDKSKYLKNPLSSEGFDPKAVVVVGIASGIFGTLKIPSALKVSLFVATCSFSAAHAYLGALVQEKMNQLALESKESKK